MHLRRAASEELGVSEVRADEDDGERTRWLPRKLERALRRRRLDQFLGGRVLAQDALEVAADGVERVAPRIAGVLGVTLQDRDRRRFAAAIAPIFERARDARRVPELGFFVEEASHLEIGVLTRFQPPEQFQEQALAVNDRRVALLGPDDLRVEWTRAAQLLVRARRNAGDRAVLAFQLTLACDHVEDRVGEMCVDDGLIQEATI